jgi:Fic family protein
MDGNGRLSRLLMNLVLGTGGVVWTTIRAEERDRYFAALEKAHIQEDYAPFAEFVRDCVLRASAT